MIEKATTKPTYICLHEDSFLLVRVRLDVLYSNQWKRRRVISPIFLEGMIKICIQEDYESNPEQQLRSEWDENRFVVQRKCQTITLWEQFRQKGGANIRRERNLPKGCHPKKSGRRINCGWLIDWLIDWLKEKNKTIGYLSLVPLPIENKNRVHSKNITTECY